MTPEALQAARAFDFLHGNWRVNHRRLVKRLCASEEWEEFGGRVDVRPIVGGLGNFDENWIELPGGAYQACTIRLLDVTTAKWNIHWIDVRDPVPSPPMVGAFDNGLALFLGTDTHDGTPVVVRFLWSRTETATPRWEQSFSTDGGKGWELNWIMDFDRIN